MSDIRINYYGTNFARMLGYRSLFQSKLVSLDDITDVLMKKFHFEPDNSRFISRKLVNDGFYGGDDYFKFVEVKKDGTSMYRLELFSDVEEVLKSIK